MRRNTILILLLLGLFLITPLWAGQRYTVIVNPQNPLKSIAAAELKMIYLGEKATWESGVKIRVAALTDGDIHETFLQDILKLSPLRFAHHWQRMVFTGSGTAPKAFKTDAQVKEYVKDNPDAIGYIAVAALDETVKNIPIK